MVGHNYNRIVIKVIVIVTGVLSRDGSVDYRGEMNTGRHA